MGTLPGLLVHDPNSLPPLHQAAWAGDAVAIRHLCAAGADITARCDTARQHGAFFRSLTPLMVAAGSRAGAAEAVQVLLDLGAAATATSGGGVTALWYAAASGDPARVAALLAAGGDANETANNGRRAVGEAARVGAAGCLRLLLGAGASPHPANHVTDPVPTASPAASPWSAFQISLFEAAQGGSAACVRLLLAAGARVELRDTRGATALMSATTAAVVRALVRAGCPVEARDDSGCSALDHALEHGHVAAARALIRAGANGEAHDQYGLTALLRYCGTYTVRAGVVDALLRTGADVWARAPDGRTALHCAVPLWAGDRRGRLGAVVRRLVAAGLPVDVRDHVGHTPLHEAVGDEGGERSAIRALLDLGADPNAADAQGRTPLMMAVASAYDPWVVRVLLAHGAEPGRHCQAGRTAADYARENVKIWEAIVAEPAEGKDLPLDPEAPQRHRRVLRAKQTMLTLLEEHEGRASRV